MSHFDDSKNNFIWLGDEAAQLHSSANISMIQLVISLFSQIGKCMLGFATIWENSKDSAPKYIFNFSEFKFKFIFTFSEFYNWSVGPLTLGENSLEIDQSIKYESFLNLLIDNHIFLKLIIYKTTWV